MNETSEQVKSAFATASRPPKQLLTLGNSLEAAMIRNYLAARTWSQLDSESLRNYDTRADASAMVSFLTDEGFRYFLPALMLFGLHDFQKAGLLVDATLARLLREDPAQYGPEQRQAVVAWLRDLAAEHPQDHLMCREAAQVEQLWARG